MTHARGDTLGPRLGMNIDHVATVRNARYKDAKLDGNVTGASPFAHAEPDPVRAAHEAELGGALCITAHLREDRRHVRDRDIERLIETVRVKFNLEMAATESMVALAEKTRPHMCTLVPEGREEVTTEGGLDVAGQRDRLARIVRRLQTVGVRSSAFIDANETQIRAAADAGFDACELHTGPYAIAFAHTGGELHTGPAHAELITLQNAGALVRELGMQLNAGHGLTVASVGPVARIEGMEELHIGHSIVARSIYIGMRAAVREMVDTISAAAR
ncbi:MAG: pyridoxine 5'-phosphate synthase [Phycisphaeraceae bacterium]|nr:pyridoxine 5'-phosphate synthase [Phycisphaerales bacterium]MCB9859555.1 pyridoxine 5'-phosphate synthase [Phycisphaeraceae bacterium]